MSNSTRATLALEKAGVAFTTHRYDYDPDSGRPDSGRIGMQAAEAMGVPADSVLKTLMTEVDGKPVCVVLPSDREVAMKKLAAAAGGKAASMMRPTDAERMTGYVVGGISPFGQKRRVPTVIEAAALELPLVFVNGGQRGLQVRLNPNDLCTVLGAVAAPLVSDRTL
jgi:Cys-tRNA(Pro)/Cys-tRNA(Cys) deacylase